MSILTDYKVRFSIVEAYGPYKTLTSVNESLSGYIGDYRSTKEVMALLNALNNVLNNDNSPEIFSTSKGMTIGIIGHTITKFYSDTDEYANNQFMTPDYELPTEHFKIIVEAWRDYLQE